MIINDRLFHIHIPRTAGRFIRQLFRVNNYDIKHSDFNELYKEIEVPHLHYPLYNEYLKVDNLPHFTVVRNPFDRFKSQIKALPEHLEETFFSIKNQDDFNKFLNEIVPEENPLSNWFTPQDKFISDKTYIWKFENGFGDNFIKWLSDNFDIEIKIMVSKEDILKAEFDYEYIDMTIVDGYKKYIDEYYQNEYESLGYEI